MLEHSPVRNAMGDGNNAANQPPQPILPQPQHVARIAVRAPPFWKENPALWFRQLESQFHVNGIVASETKYHIAVSALDTAIINQVSDIVMNPPAANIMYETLKNRLQERYAESQERRFKKLLNNIDLGDKRPSHLWREMRDLAGAQVDDNFLRTLWLQRLPAQVQAILSTDDEDINHTLATADRIMEVLSINVDVQMVSSPSTSENNPVSSCVSDFERLSMQVSELTKQVSSLTEKKHSGRDRSYSRGRHANAPPRNRNDFSEKMCWYHFHFGSNATKCNKPCSFRAEN